MANTRTQDDLEGEALRRCDAARKGRKITLTGPQAVALQDFYKRLLDTKSKCGLVLEGNHP